MITEPYPTNSEAMLNDICTVKALISPGTYTSLCFGLSGAAHYADDSYTPIDQVNVMENSLQSTGSLTQKPTT